MRLKPPVEPRMSLGKRSPWRAERSLAETPGAVAAARVVAPPRQGHPWGGSYLGIICQWARGSHYPCDPVRVSWAATTPVLCLRLASCVLRLMSKICRLLTVVCRLSSVVCRLSSVVCRLLSQISGRTNNVARETQPVETGTPLGRDPRCGGGCKGSGPTQTGSSLGW